MVVFYRGKRIELHYIEPEDYRIIRKYYSDPEVRRYLAAPWRYRSIEDTRQWVARVLSGEIVAFKIMSKEFPDDPFSGVISLAKINFRARRAEMGYRIRKDRRNRGYATEAVSLMLKHAFDRMYLYLVYAMVKAPNRASARVLEKNGFRLVGRLPGYTIAPGIGRTDLLIYAITRERWKEASHKRINRAGVRFIRFPKEDFYKW